MRKKSTATKKGTVAHKSKSAVRKIKPRASTDDVFRLLKAVNEITLKRIEDRLHSHDLTVLDRLSDIIVTVHAIKRRVGA
jgi:hypothetical protein